MNRKLTEFSPWGYIRFVDYTDDAWFYLNDEFTWALVGHPNTLSAMEFSKIPDEKVINAGW